MESRVERGLVQVAQPHLHAVLPEVWNADDHTDTRVSGVLIPTVSPSLAWTLKVTSNQRGSTCGSTCGSHAGGGAVERLQQ